MIGFILSFLSCTAEEGALGGSTGSTGSSGTTGSVPGPLSVLSVSPADDAADVVRDCTIVITFSRAVDPASFSTNTVQLTKWWGDYQYPGCIAGTFDFSQNPLVRFTPASPLDEDFPFHLDITTGILDQSGDPLSSAFHSEFWTSFSLSSEYPHVVSSTPATNAAGVYTSSRMQVTFSEMMAQNSLTVSSPASSTDVVQLYPTGNPAALVTLSRESLDKTNFFFTPQSALSSGTEYTLVVKKAARAWSFSGDGDMMLEDYPVVFTTGSGSDPVALSVSSADPSAGAGGVGTGSAVRITFNKQIDMSSLFLSYSGTDGTFRVSRYADLSSPEEGTLSISNYSGGSDVVFRLTGGAAFDANRVYYVGITGGSSGVKALSGALMSGDYSATFTTEAGAAGTIADIRAASGSCAITVSGVYMTFFRNYPDGYKGFFVQKEKDGDAVLVLVDGSFPPLYTTEYIATNFRNVDLTVTYIQEYNGLKQAASFTITENAADNKDLTWMVQNMVTVISNQVLGESYEARYLQVEGFLSNYAPGSSARNRRYDLYYNSGQYVRMLIDQDITDGMGIGNGSRVRLLAPLQQDGDGYFIKPYFYTSADGVSAADLNDPVNYPLMQDIVQITNW